MLVFVICQDLELLRVAVENQRHGVADVAVDPPAHCPISVDAVAVPAPPVSAADAPRGRELAAMTMDLAEPDEEVSVPNPRV